MTIDEENELKYPGWTATHHAYIKAIYDNCIDCPDCRAGVNLHTGKGELCANHAPIILPLFLATQATCPDRQLCTMAESYAMEQDSSDYFAKMQEESHQRLIKQWLAEDEAWNTSAKQDTSPAL